MWSIVVVGFALGWMLTRMKKSWGNSLRRENGWSDTARSLKFCSAQFFSHIGGGTSAEVHIETHTSSDVTIIGGSAISHHPY